MAYVVRRILTADIGMFNECGRTHTHTHTHNSSRVFTRLVATLFPATQLSARLIVCVALVIDGWRSSFTPTDAMSNSNPTRSHPDNYETRAYARLRGRVDEQCEPTVCEPTVCERTVCRRTLSTNSVSLALSVSVRIKTPTLCDCSRLA